MPANEFYPLINNINALLKDIDYPNQYAVRQHLAMSANRQKKIVALDMDRHNQVLNIFVANHIRELKPEQIILALFTIKGTNIRYRTRISEKDIQSLNQLIHCYSENEIKEIIRAIYTHQNNARDNVNQNNHQDNPNETSEMFLKSLSSMLNDMSLSKQSDPNDEYNNEQQQNASCEHCQCRHTNEHKKENHSPLFDGSDIRQLVEEQKNTNTPKSIDWDQPLNNRLGKVKLIMSDKAFDEGYRIVSQNHNGFKFRYPVSVETGEPLIQGLSVDDYTVHNLL